MSASKDASTPSTPRASRGASAAAVDKPSAEVAAALKYKPERDSAPRVVAKGKGEIARRIIDLATASGIPVHRDSDLAALLSAVELDGEIPVEAFAAVAEILAYIYRANAETPPSASN